MNQVPNPYLSVLVVEDDACMQMLMPKLLEPFNLPVVMAENGKDAIEKLNTIEAENVVILLDMDMPVMNGLEFLKKWEQEGQNPNKKNTFIYIHSASSVAELPQLAALSNSRVCGTIAKPAPRDTLHTIFDPLLMSRKAS